MSTGEHLAQLLDNLGKNQAVELRGGFLCVMGEYTTKKSKRTIIVVKHRYALNELLSMMELRGVEWVANLIRDGK